MLPGLERIDDLAVMPVVGRADADGVYVFVGEQVGVVDVPLRVGAGLLLDEGADFVFLVFIDLADGDEVDLRPLLAELGERLHVALEAAAARADEADADARVGVGGDGPRRGSGDSRGGGHAGGGERGGPKERATGEVGRGHVTAPVNVMLGRYGNGTRRLLVVRPTPYGVGLGRRMVQADRP